METAKYCLWSQFSRVLVEPLRQSLKEVLMECFDATEDDCRLFNKTEFHEWHMPASYIEKILVDNHAFCEGLL